MATLHVTEIEKGQTQELHLCEECAQKYMATASPEPSSGAGPAGMSETELEELERLVCPHCKLTFREFRSQGRLGCPQCYTAFRDELVPLLENIHGDIQHVGKFPRRAPVDSRKRYELVRLRNELQAAVAEESYEQAAKLRDQIQALEHESASPGDE
ncbi:MAG: UvrB/UvrC motif-containing protein [Planctomycetota bacterium]|nr:UvrB/UvrC motif-containing protein [Planctomycetota bacterium]